MQKLALKTAGRVFLFFGVLHVGGVLFKGAGVFGDFTVPMSWSVVGAAVALALSLWMFTVSGK